ncbi:MAG: hypothetical protein L6R35_003046 [Caloplaca aegaea]|nr:MAG: hypothetical protein L6R35_003046 [Caloplaca aegaea]
MAATNVRSPSGPQDCTLYYYHWPCGHTIGVKCTRCNLSDSRNIEAHLTHQHKEVQLPHPKHHCPECGGLALHELRWASTSNPDAVQSQEATTAVFNRPDVIEAQLEQDVYEKESPWMNDDLFTEDPTANEMRGEIIMDLYRSQLHVEDLEQRLHQTFRDPPARASASSRPLTASATPFQPGVPWVASHQHQPQQPNVPQQNGSSMVLALRDRGRGHGQHIPERSKAACHSSNHAAGREVKPEGSGVPSADITSSTSTSISVSTSSHQEAAERLLSEVSTPGNQGSDSRHCMRTSSNVVAVMDVAVVVVVAVEVAVVVDVVEDDDHQPCGLGRRENWTLQPEKGYIYTLTDSHRQQRKKLRVSTERES